MEEKTDVLVVGACTAGLYFAGLMAAQGYKVLVCDKSPEEKLGNRYDVIHIGKEHFKRFGLSEPQPGDPDYVTCFDKVRLRSASNKWEKNNTFPILVLRRLPLMKRLSAWAREKGVKFIFDSDFEKPLFNSEGKLAGGQFRQNGGELKVNARLTADASGIPAVVRTRLPQGYGVESFSLDSSKLSSVILYYIKPLNLKDFKLPSVTTFVHYHVWVASCYDP
jgi:flavin-dependent dehydrogenase